MANAIQARKTKTRATAEKYKNEHVKHVNGGNKRKCKKGAPGKYGSW